MNAFAWFIAGFITFWLIDKLSKLLLDLIILKQTKKVEASLAEAIIKQQKNKRSGDGDKQSK